MKAHTTLELVKPQASVAMILDKSASRQPVFSPGNSPQIAKSSHSGPQARQQNAAKAPEDIRRRYETPFKTSWHHGGINE
ncbi:MAG: hypothetical protein PHY43_10260 [Verrucomicrobiales bacterium]|nr:hypothetical protein [Verrucomicrobiales bacterium]